MPGSDATSSLWSVLRSPVALVRRVPDVAWVMVWMWLLLPPLGEIVAGRTHPVVPAAVGLAAFAVAYPVLVVRGYARPPHTPSRAETVQLLLFAAVGVALAAGYVRQDPSWLALLLYVATTGGVLLPPKVGGVWTAAVVGLVLVIGLAARLDVDTFGWTAFGTLLGSSLVITVRQMRGYIHELTTTRAELARTAVNEERLRFSRDLHELLGHTLTLIVVKAQVVRRLAETDPAAATAAAADIERIGRQALRDVREAVTGYRGRTFAAELDEARATLADAGIALRVTQHGGPLPPGADAIFSVVLREGVTNLLRHSGASELDVLVRNDSGGPVVELVDNGTGSTTLPRLPGNGLRGLTERLDAVGGSLSAGPVAPQGFRLAARVPAVYGAEAVTVGEGRS